MDELQRDKRILKGVFRFLPLKLIIISGLFLGALFLFALIVHRAVLGNEQAFDNGVFSSFSKFSTQQTITAMRLLTYFGSQYFLIPAYILLIGWFVARKKYRYSLHIVAVVLSSTALMFAIKELTRRHRPLLPVIQGIENYSFPSGHTLSLFIFCGIIVYIIWHGVLTTSLKWLYSILLLLFTVLVGVSRIVLRLHYATDVIASFCLGIVWSVLSLWLMRRISRRRSLNNSAA